MQKIYNYQDYRAYMRDFVAHTKKVDSNKNFSALAKAIRVQKSYVSKVVNKEKHFSEDQFYLACEFLGLHGNERDYLNTLFDSQTTGLAKRREALEQRLTLQRKDAASIKRSIVSEEDRGTVLQRYYANPFHQVIYEALSIERYQIEPRRLTDDLGISKTKLQQCLNELTNLGFVEEQGERLVPQKNNLHLPKSDPTFSGWLSQLRTLSQAKVNSDAIDESFCLSACFAADEKSKQLILEKLANFVQFAQKLTKKCNKEHIYQLNLDLLRWL